MLLNGSNRLSLSLYMYVNSFVHVTLKVQYN